MRGHRPRHRMRRAPPEPRGRRALLRRCGSAGHGRRPGGQRAGLVEDHPVDAREPLQRGAVLHQDALAEQPPGGHHLRRGHREAQRAGTGDDQHRDRDEQRRAPVAARGDQPAGEGRRRREMHDRRIEPRRPVGDPHVAAPPRLGALQHPDHLGQERLPRRTHHHRVDRARQVQRAGFELVVAPDRHRRRLAGDQRAVDVGLAGPHPHVDRHPLARLDAQHHARLDRVERHVPGAPVAADDRGSLRPEPFEPGDRAARPVAHQAVEIAADEQEEQERHRRVVEGVLASPGASRTG